MGEKSGQKVTPLFKFWAKSSRASGDTRPQSALDPLKEELDALLGTAEEAVCDPPHHPRAEPPGPNHRNARQSPQCDRYTWRGTARASIANLISSSTMQRVLKVRRRPPSQSRSIG